MSTRQLVKKRLSMTIENQNDCYPAFGRKLRRFSIGTGREYI